MMRRSEINNTLPDQQLKKDTANNKDFNRFVRNCIKELKSTGITEAYTLEQIAAINSVIEIEYIKIDGVYHIKKY